MNIETLEKRKLELKAQQDQLIANANSVSGAIQTCDYFIAELKKELAAPAAEPAAQ